MKSVPTNTLLAFAAWCLLAPPASAATIDDRDILLSDWRYDPVWLNTTPLDGFACIAYDPLNAVWRMFCHSNPDAGVGTVVQYAAPNARGPWAGRTLALGHGTSGNWDDKSTGVPFAWCEAGQARPWRMIYRGSHTGTSISIGLATSLDGITWERKDTAGSALSTYVLTGGGAGAWDNGDIDFGGLIKVGALYYLYFDTINSPRKVGLATSADLVTWSKDGANPCFSGVTDYADTTQAGTPDLTAGFFCPDVVRWDRRDGTTRYLMLIPHYRTGNLSPRIDAYCSPDPLFAVANRTFLGTAFDPSPAGNNLALCGCAYGDSSCDTPRIITDDIFRNVLTSQLTGGDVYCTVAGYIGAVGSPGWETTAIVHHKTLHGAQLSGVSADFPISAPVHSLMPSGDATTKGLWLPGLTQTLRDLTGGGYHLAPNGVSIDANGILFTAANTTSCHWWHAGSNTIAPLNAITGDFTIELTATWASDRTSTYRALVQFDGTLHHFYWYVGCAAGPTYTFNFTVTSGGASKTATCAVGSIVLGQRYRFAVTRTGGMIYFFKDGVLLNGGGTAFNWPIDSTADADFWLSNATYPWDGYIDEIRFSNAARWTANYTAAPLPYTYPATGTIFAHVSDLGTSGAVSDFASRSSGSVSRLLRAAASAADQSVTAADFGTFPGTVSAARYQQAAFTLSTSDPASTPSLLDGDLLLHGGPMVVGRPSLSPGDGPLRVGN